MLEASYVLITPANEEVKVSSYSIGGTQITTAFSAQQPLACCKLEKWNARSFQRYYAKAQVIRDKNCVTATPDYATTNADVYDLIPGFRANTHLFKSYYEFAITGVGTDAFNGVNGVNNANWGICQFSTTSTNNNAAIAAVSTNMRLPGTDAA